MADEKPRNEKARAIRAKLNAIAPWPETGDVTALGLARHYAATAYERAVRPRPEDDDRARVYRIELMCAEFSAALALAALADPLSPPLFGPEGFGATSPGELATMASTQIRDILEDGEGIGEWLYEFLGKEACEQITGLVAELEVAMAEAPAPADDAGKAAGR